MNVDNERKTEALRKIRLSALMLEVGFKSENLGEIIQCQIELDGLADRLQAQHGDLVSTEQCEQARRSLEAFVALLDMTLQRLITEAGSSGPVRPMSPTLANHE